MVYVSIVVQESNQVTDGVFQTFPYEPTVVFEIICVFLLREFDRTQALHLFRDVLASGEEPTYVHRTMTHQVTGRLTLTS